MVGHTVESITDNDTIVVNYEHCADRGDGILKLFDYSGSLSIKRTVKWFGAPLGIGQTWVDVGWRTQINATYINSTGRPIQVLPRVVGQMNFALVDENGNVFEVADTNAGDTISPSAILPDG